MADDEELASPELPPRAGLGTFLGLKPQDWLATLGGLLQGIPLGRGPMSSQVHPFNALFPLAQGVANSDQLARQRAGVQALQGQYGGETDLPEFKTAMLLANQGDVKGAMSLLGRGITDRNQRQRESRLATQQATAAEHWGNAQRPVTEPGITSFRPTTQEDLLAPPSQAPAQNFQDVNRPPDVREIIGRLNAIADPTERGLAFGKADATIARRNLEESKLRPKTEVKDNRFIRYDPLRGTATAGAELPETTAQKATRLLREARTTKEQALTERAQRPSNAQPGTEANPHITYKTYSAPDGTRTQYELRAFTKPNPDAPGGVEQITRARPLGAAPWKPFAPRDATGGGTKETLEQTEKITPSKRITDTATFTALQDGVQDVVNDVTAKFKGQGLDFAVPGPYVTLPSGQKVRKEDVLAKAFKARHGVDTTMTWDGSQFRITKASVPEVREPVEKRRIVGPAGTIKANTPQDTSDDEEE